MAGYWIIAPYETGADFEGVWQFDLAEGLISIGWAEIGDVSSMTKEQLSAAVATTYPEKPPQTKALYTNMLWRFFHEIVPGDIVVARRGRMNLAGVGDVTGRPYYSPGRNSQIHHPNFLPIAWREQPRNLDFPAVVFPMHSLAPISDEKFQKLIGGMVIDPPSEATETTADPNIFVLEKYLEEFIVANFQNIFRDAARIYVDNEGNSGQQYSTEVGPIDILAFEPEKNSFLVIELKKGRPSDQVVGQVLRYMGWVQKHLCKNGQAVRGLVICKEPDPKLTYALSMTDKVQVQYYSVDFKLNDKL